MLLRHARALIGCVDRDAVADVTVEVVKRALGVSYALFMVPQDGERVLAPAGRAPDIPAHRATLENSPEGEAFRRESTVHCPRLDQEHRFAYAPALRERGIVSVLAVPVRGIRRALGVLVLYGVEGKTFHEHVEPFLLPVAHQAAATLERLRAQRAADVVEETYGEFFDNVPVGLYRSTPDGRILRANFALVNMLRYPDRQTLLNTPAHALYVEPGDRERWKKLLARNGVAQGVELRLRRYDGSVVWVRNTAHAVRGPDGRVLYYDGIVEDITRRKQAEQDGAALVSALERRAAHLEALNAIISLAAKATDVNVLLEVALDYTLRAMRLRQGGIWLERTAVVRRLPARAGKYISAAVRSAGLAIREPIAVDDWHTLSPNHPYVPLKPVMERLGIRASITVAIEVHGQPLGGVNVVAPEPRPWDPEDVAFVEAVGQQIGGAATRIQLLRATQERARLATRLAEIFRLLSRFRGEEEVVAAIGEGGRQLSGADRVAVYVRRELSVTCAWSQGLSPEYVAAVCTHVALLPGRHFVERTEPIFVEDVEALPPDHPLAPLARAEGYRAVALWPLVHEGRTVAILGCYYDHPRERSDVEREIMLSFCRQAALALVNARLFQADRRQRQVMETLLEISETVSSSLNFREVIRRTARYTARACQADRCSIFLLDEGRLLRPIMSQFADGHTDSTMWHHFRTEVTVPLEHVPPLHQAVQSRRPVLLDDLTQEESDILRGWADRYNARSVLVVPLLARGRVIGLMVLDNMTPHRTFADDQVRLATAIGSRVAASIENALLYAAQRQDAGRLALLHEVTAALLDTLDEATLLDRVLTGSLRLVPHAERGAVVLVEGLPPQLRVGPVIGYASPIEDLDVWPYVLQALEERRPILVNRLSHQGGVPVSAGATFAVPMIIEEGRVIGLIVLESSKPTAFDEAGVQMVTTFATTATAALHNVWLHAHVHELAITDPLTGLYNRRALFTFGQREVERARRFGRPLSAIMFDLDRFKRVNDTYGHVVGDQVLAWLAHVCQEVLRRVDLLSRYGGEEFVALLFETDGMAAWHVAERLRTTVAQTPVPTERGPLSVTISLGVATLDEMCPNLEALLARADHALYEAKRAGRNCVRRWTGMEVV